MPREIAINLYNYVHTSEAQTKTLLQQLSSFIGNQKSSSNATQNQNSVLLNLCDLVLQMTQTNATKRPNAKQLLQNKLFIAKQHSKNSLLTTTNKQNGKAKNKENEPTINSSNFLQIDSKNH